MGFFKSLAEAHGKKALQAVTSEIVALDPKTATEAQLAAMSDDLQRTTLKLAQFRADATRERREADEAKVRVDRMQAAGEKMFADYQAEQDPTKKSALEQSLMGLRQQVLTLTQDYQRELSEAVDAESLVTEAEAAVTEKGKHIMEAKTNLQNALRDRDRAIMAEKSSEERRKNAEELAGLRTSAPGGLNSALDILHQQTEAARVKADANRLTIDQVTVVDPGSTKDPNVLAALAAVDATGSPNDLAALFGPKSAEPLQLQQH